MSEHYHDPSDIRLLKEMRKLAPKDYEAWFNLDSIVKREDGAIPRKYRELYLSIGSETLTGKATRHPLA